MEQLSKPKVIVAGAAGMLGREVMYALDEAGYAPEVLLCRLEMAGWSYLSGRDVLINCAGAVPQKDYTPAYMMQANAYGPHRLAEVAPPNMYIMHVSTDCVFSAPGPHYEETPPSPVSLYGASKLAGEIGHPHLTVRTSFIGWANHGLVHDVTTREWMQCSQRLLWNGHTARTVAKLLVQLIDLRPTGLLHIPGDFQTRYSLALTLKSYLRAEQLTVRQDDSFQADRLLDSNRFYSLGLTLPNFHDELAELAKGRLA